jgi:hypothetical protein
MSESWTWRLLDASGGAADSATSQSFPTQADAEGWIGEEWRTLLDTGVESVTLLRDGVEVYGPMGLRPE